jgi:hypothetical protein
VVVAQDDDVTLRIRQGREQALGVENRIDPRAAVVRRLARAPSAMCSSGSTRRRRAQSRQQLMAI